MLLGYRIAVYIPLTFPIAVLSGLFAVSPVNNFVLSALVLLANALVMSVAYAFEMVLAIHLNETAPSTPSD